MKDSVVRIGINELRQLIKEEAGPDLELELEFIPVLVAKQLVPRLGAAGVIDAQLGYMSSNEAMITGRVPASAVPDVIGIFDEMGWESETRGNILSAWQGY